MGFEKIDPKWRCGELRGVIGDPHFKILQQSICVLDGALVKVMDLRQACHELQPSTSEDPPCRRYRCTLNMTSLKHPPGGVMLKIRDISIDFRGSQYHYKRPGLRMSSRSFNVKNSLMHTLKGLEEKLKDVVMNGRLGDRIKISHIDKSDNLCNPLKPPSVENTISTIKLVTFPAKILIIEHVLSYILEEWI
ncbi:hypothetical protein TNCV_1364821 [Trichonephila clavipes]|nr:hypothetical protein TNCV_1364821 [Trichonephila clavipes]